MATEHENWLKHVSLNVNKKRGVIVGSRAIRKGKFGDDNYPVPVDPNAPPAQGGIDASAVPSGNSLNLPGGVDIPVDPNYSATGGYQPNIVEGGATRMTLPGGVAPPITQYIPPPSPSSSSTGGYVSAGDDLLGGLSSSLPGDISSAIPVASKIVDAASKVVSAGGQPGDVLKQAVALVSGGASGPALSAAAKAVAPQAQTAFNTGVAIVNGVAKGAIPPPGSTPAASAAYLAAHGLQGAPVAVKTAVATVLANHPASRPGLATGVAHARKGLLNGIPWVEDAKLTLPVVGLGVVGFLLGGWPIAIGGALVGVAYDLKASKTPKVGI